MKKRLLLLVVSSLLVLLGTKVSHAQFNTIWTGNAGNGLYSDFNNWTNGVPNGNFNVFIDGGNSVNSIVNMDVIAPINNLDISPGDTFNINNGIALTLSGSSIENNGQINVNGGAIEINNSNAVLSGGASNEVVLNGGSIFGATASSGFTNHSNIRGFGVIGNVGLTNTGEIVGNNVGGSLQIIMDTDFSNSGVIKSTGAGMLDIVASGGSAIPITLFNSGGIIQADVATTVSIRDGVTVDGGTLQGNGIIKADGTDVKFVSVVNNDLLSISNGSSAGFGGTINNAGRIIINSSGNTTTFDSLRANLTGGGTVELVGSNSEITTSVTSVFSQDFLTTDNTIIGAGMIRISQFKNTGTIASAGAGNVLSIEAEIVNNSGTIESRENSTLSFLTTTSNTGQSVEINVNNNGGVIQAQDNSTVRLGYNTINGGTLRTFGSGKIEANGTIVEATTLNGVTVDGHFDSGWSGAFLQNTITLTNQGIMESDRGGSGQSKSLYVDGNVTLNGTGEVWVNNGGGLGSLHPLNNSSSATNNATIRNSAGLGTIETIEFTNNGTVISQGTGSMLVIYPIAANSQTPFFTNNGTLRADEGEIFIRNQNGAFTNYSAGTLTGGTYEVNFGGAIRADVFDITTNRATIRLSGDGAAFTTTASTPVNALANFSINDTIGSFSLVNGAQLTTASASIENRSMFLVDEDSTLSIGSGAGEFDQAAGTVTINGRLNATSLDMGGGTLKGHGEIAGDLIQLAGIVAPGTSTGSMSVFGDYFQSAGATLEIELASLSDFDFLDSIASTNLAGTLDIKLLDGYRPKFGDEYIILQTGTLMGNFSNVINPGDYQFNVGYFRNEGFVKLTVASVPEPSSVLLLTVGLGLVGLRRRR